MKVAIVITNLQGGGAEKVAIRLSEALLGAGVDARLILLENLIAYDLAQNVKPYIVNNAKNASKGFFAKIFMARKLKALIKEASKDGEFNAIISNLPFTNEICALAKLENLWFCIHDSLSVEVSKAPKNKASRKRKKYQKLYNDKNVIAVSQGVANDLTQRLNVTPKKLKVIYNPFDIERIKTLSSEPTSVVLDYKYVLHVGRFAKQKRHDLALEAWKIVIQSVKTHKLVLLTNVCDELKSMVREYDLQDFVETINFQQNPYAFMKNADLLILSSDHEGLPTVIIGSLICGTPVVSTDCPSGPAEILNNDKSSLVDCDNPQELAIAIINKITRKKQAPDIDLSIYSNEAVLNSWLGLLKDK